MFNVTVTLTGNVIAEPELGTTRNGVPYATFGVAATSRRYDKASGTMIQGDTLYLQVKCWRALARNVAAELAKGTPVVVQGRLVTRTTVNEGPEGERRRQHTDLHAEAIGIDLARMPVAAVVAADVPELIAAA